MKLLVTVKRVEDPEISPKITPDGLGIDAENMKYVVNPYDEIAIEEALRVRDAAEGEVIVLTIGTQDAAHQIRTALAMGADRAIHVVCDTPLDPWAASQVIAKVVADEACDLVIMGKQAVDDDMGQMGQLVAERLGFGQVTFASKEASLESEEEKKKVPGLSIADGRVSVLREVDGGVETLSVAMPAVITTELRLNNPRYASLPGIMKAKKKKIDTRTLADFGVDAAPRVQILKMEPPAKREAGVQVPDVATLVEKLKTEAKVL